MGGREGAIERTTLGPGVRVVTEAMPDVRSVAVGFWIDLGSRDEPDERSGATHFLEHLLFKGTERRSARQIAEAVEGAGGEMNAFTDRECTAYYVRAADERLDLVLDVLSDILWNPALRPDELEAERQVILEEIRMRDDMPDDLVHDLFAEALLPGPLGREVLGTPESIGAMQRDDVALHHGEHYTGANVVVAVAGNVDHEAVVDGVGARFAGVPEQPRGPREPVGTPPEPHRVVRQSTEQAHVMLGVRGLSRNDDDRYALGVLNQALGGGMSSRLFQEVREERGLAYAVFSYRLGFEETGLFAAYAGTAPHQARDVLKLLETELDRVVADRGVSDEELERAKRAVKGSLALSVESPAARMHRIGRAELMLGDVPTVDELIERVEQVTPDDVGRLVDRLLVEQPRTVAAVGPFDADDLLD